MPISLEDDSRVERRLSATTATCAPREPAASSLLAALLTSSFDVLREEIAQLQRLAASMHHLRRQVRGAIAAYESGALPTDLLSGIALVKLEIDLLTLKRQMEALVQRHYHRLRCIQRGRHWLSAHPVNERSRR